MQSTIGGIYEKGKIILDKIPPIKDKVRVVVTVIEEKPAGMTKRVLGSLKGKISIPDDFNEPINDLKDYMW